MSFVRPLLQFFFSRRGKKQHVNTTSTQPRQQPRAGGVAAARPLRGDAPQDSQPGMARSPADQPAARPRRGRPSNCGNEWIIMISVYDLRQPLCGKSPSYWGNFLCADVTKTTFSVTSIVHTFSMASNAEIKHMLTRISQDLCHSVLSSPCVTKVGVGRRVQSLPRACTESEWPTRVC